MAMGAPAPESAGRGLEALGLALLVLGVLLKLALLLTSPSMADGDEAVEGLMALNILERGVHPVYAYGISYGAGVFVEAHVAALLFALLGATDVALKSVGLLFWLATLGLVYAIARGMAGPRADGRDRARLAAALSVATLVSAAVLWPDAPGIWDPSARRLELLRRVAALPRLASTPRAPNLSAFVAPSGLALTVAVLWLAALAFVLIRRAAPRRLVG